jgi:glutamate dehydrogenase/leucine dehydrogenase
MPKPQYKAAYLTCRKSDLKTIPKMTKNATVLLVGAGGVGTIAALNLTLGGQAAVTTVLRSNYTKVTSEGFHIKSIDHGEIKGWRPHEGRQPQSFSPVSNDSILTSPRR